MKRLLWIVLGMLPAACAASHPQASASVQANGDLQAAATTQPVAHVYAPAVADALAFDPPAIQGTPRVDLSREDRRANAFIGYEEDTIETYDIYTNDRQSNDPYDTELQRRATIDKTGVEYR